jgi:hypothetical protein
MNLSKKQRKVVSLILQIAIEDRPYLGKEVNQFTWRYLNKGWD